MPYMLDDRFSPDSVWIVAEQDFRFYEEDQVSSIDWMSEVAGSAGPEEPGSEEQGGESSATAEPQAGVAEDVVGGPQYHVWRAPHRRQERDLSLAASEELQDLLSLMTAASRLQRGDIVWFSWVGTSKKTSSPSHGSTLLGVTKRGALAMQEAMQREKKHPTTGTSGSGTS